MGIDKVDVFSIEELTGDNLHCRANTFIIHENALAGKGEQLTAGDV
jgi:hypothetical protein